MAPRATAEIAFARGRSIACRTPTHRHWITLRTALTVYMLQLDKLAATEEDLFVPSDETKGRQSQARSLSDRLGGQIEMPEMVDD